MFNQSSQIKSPCIGHCCLDEKDICMGCFRRLDEITDWHQASDLKKSKIIRNCEKRKMEHQKLFL